MGKVLASYQARITLRERDDLEEPREAPDVPTIARLEEAIVAVLEAGLQPRPPVIHVTAERVDR